MYKLTKGTLSRVREDQNGVQELLDKGYKLDGEVNDNYEVINANPVFNVDPLASLRAELVALGCAPSTAERYKSEKTLLEKIAEFKEKTE